MKENGPKKTDLDLAAIRTRLENTRGKEYWRSLEELAGSEKFEEFLHNEFPQQTGLLGEGMDRRTMLKLMGASLAFAGLSACAYMPTERILPYVRQPEDLVPGQPLFFASAFNDGGFAEGIVVESHMGRPTKIEGNEQHPASLGATTASAQASILTLYDPDRSQTVLHLGDINTWIAFATEVNLIRADQQTRKGAGLRLLTETVTSPTLAAQIKSLLQQFPEAKWHQFEPIGLNNTKAGAKMVFGEMVQTIYRFDQADVVLALDADFLFSGPGNVRHARDFTSRRRMLNGQKEMNRLYVAEGTPTLTGAMADHRLILRSSEVAAVTLAVAQALAVAPSATQQDPVVSSNSKWISAVVRDLQKHRGKSLVVVGEQQPPVVHALVHAINQALGNINKTIVYTDPVEAAPVDHLESLRQLVDDLNASRVDTLIILGGNPVFTAPADLHFSDSILKAKTAIHLSLYEDETSRLCHWHLPEAHYLETWSDLRAFDGTTSIIQPLIAPLYDGKSAHELVSAFSGEPTKTGYQIVQDYWKAHLPAHKNQGAAFFEEFWQKGLVSGVLVGTATPVRAVTPKAKFDQQDVRSLGSGGNSQDALEIVFRPDPTIGDGRGANNGWLQELPKPLSKVTWDNVVWISPNTAQRLGVTTEDVVLIQYQGGEIKSPVWVMPGHADNSVTVFFGYGRSFAGRVGSGVGYNAYPIRTSSTPWFGLGARVQKTGDRYPLAATDHHYSMEGRNLVRVGKLEEFRKDPHFAVKENPPPPPSSTLYPGFKYTGYSWGMAVNLNSCIGCNACVVACQAENNIPVVGKDQVTRGREMHWIRIDRYYEGGVEQPATYHEPVMCMQCENAPCEEVCPVGATNHSSEGLNQMVYNRCVGTRYCSNNCPYKVRRFNFYQYGDWNSESLKLQRNPNVTVRSRGVMEKCTYCVQRINAAKITAEEQNREVRDGEIQTACQQVCPTQAIVFGNINDSQSQVSQWKADPLNYGLLEELTTRPRTTYLARVRNPNPELEPIQE